MASPAPIAAIIGPTGVGKTDLALALAPRLPVEILVADSRQVYRGMEVGTAKPDRVTRAAVPHHLLDLVEPGQPFSVADWVAAARAVIPEVTGRGRLPLVVGGSGLYVSALVDGYALDAGAPDPAQRAELAATLVSGGVAALAERLARVDPDAARRIDLHNPRRVTRALERVAAIGHGSPPEPRPWTGRVAMIVIGRPREVLNRRIDARAAWLFGHGLLDEVRSLLEAGHDPRRPPLTSHGYGEAARHLAGEWSLERAVAVTAQRTRQYAKRQATWFRGDPRVAWVEAGEAPADAPTVVDEAERVLRALLA
jgi:tRNA dimethylallyltransferase